MTLRPWVLAALTAALGSGCDAEVRAQLVVVIHTDMQVPRDLDAITLRVRSADDPDAPAVRDQPVALGPSEGQVLLPQSFGVAPKDGDTSRRVRIEVEARRGDTTLFTTYAITSFVSGARLRLDIYLAGRCVVEAMECEPDESCGRDGCQTAEVPPGSLSRFDPRAPLEGDAGMSLPDAGPIDGGSHAPGPGGPLDSCTADEDCRADLWCEDFGDGDHRCRPRCVSESDCDGDEVCAGLYAMGELLPYGVCTDGCDPIAQTGCPAGLACDVRGFSMPGGAPGSAPVCRAAGRGRRGMSCDSSSSCLAGLTCISGRCALYCADDATCASARDQCDTLAAFPVGVCGASRVDAVTEVVAGGRHTCARTTGAFTYCWGRDLGGQLGNGDPPADSTSPVMVMGTPARPFKRLAAGSNHTCGIDNSSNVWCWGDDSYGQLGDGGGVMRTAPVNITALASTVELAAGANHTCISATDRSVRCWGWNAHSQLGDGTAIDRPAPTTIMMLTGDALALGGHHSCIIHSPGVECWGDDARGQLGDGVIGPTRRMPDFAPGLDDATLIAAGEEHTCAVLGDGTVRCAGANDSGQLGNGILGGQTPSFAPAMAAATAVDGLDAGFAHTCVTFTDATAQCWGENGTGQIGTGDTTDVGIPFTLALPPIASISAGEGHTCAVTFDGALYCWGDNAAGQLGNGTTTGTTSPIEITLP